MLMNEIVKFEGYQLSWPRRFAAKPELIIEKLEAAGGNLAGMLEQLNIIRTNHVDNTVSAINLTLAQPENAALAQRFQTLVMAYANGRDWLAKSRAIQQISDYTMPKDTRPGEMVAFGKFWFHYMKGKSVSETDTALEISEILDNLHTAIAEMKREKP
jgi:hypothetical protein